MSKTRGNVVDPWEMIERFGADTVRLYLLASSQVWLPKRFDQEAIGEVARGFVNQLRNTYKFFADYAGDWSPGGAPAPAERPLVDRWLLSRLDATIEAVHAAWSGYDPTAGVRTADGVRRTSCPTGTSGSTGRASGRWMPSRIPPRSPRCTRRWWR